MQNTILILLISTLQVLATNTYSQTKQLNLKLRGATIKEVLVEIEDQSEFYFLYNSALIDVTRTVDISVKGKKVDDILVKLFDKNDVNIEINDRYIILTPVAEEIEQQKYVTGKVTSAEDNEGLPGVNVIIKGTANGTVTNVEGDYKLSIPDESTVLVFSSVGFLKEEVIVGNQTIIDFVLYPDITALEEIVVIGYGTQKKSDITGAISTMSANDIIKISSTSTAQVLQGRMSGVQVTQTNGEPGSGSIIKIRGIGSLRSNNSPLILVDGYLGSLDGIDPNDIESISVLKDASAAAIYGARAANGVILVTTKRGETGALKVDLVVEYGISSLTKRPDWLNSQDFAQKSNENNAWNGAGPLWVGEYAPENLEGGTQWFDEIYNQGSIGRYNVNLSGGSEKTKYALSLGYTTQDGLIDNTSYERLNARFNFDHKFNKTISVGANFSLGRDKRLKGNENIWGDGIKYNGYGLAIAATRSSPSIPAYFEDGTKGIYLPDIKPGEYAVNGTLPPHWYMGNKDFNSTGQNNRATLFAEINIIDGLKYKAVFNTTQGSYYNTEWSGTWEAYIPGEEYPAQSNTTNGLYTKSGTGYAWEIQQLLTYEKTFGKHSISALAGFSAEDRTSEWVGIGKENFPGNELRVANAGTVIYSDEGSKRVTRFESLFGRIQYDYDGRYILNATVRRDGSSAFAPGKQYGTFPSISGAWSIGNEAFMQNQSLISHLKIRAGYGQLGNAGIPSFKWISTYKLTDGHPFGSGFPQTYQPAYYPTEMTNEDVKWETTTTFDIGLEFGILKDKMTFEFDYYDKSTTDLLWPATIPQSAGSLDGPMVNIGEVTNEGWELTIHWDDNIGDFQYGISANISNNINTVVDMGGIPDQLSGNVMVKEGYPINSFWGYKIDGIWRTWAELDENAHRTGDIRPGDYRFLDINGVDAEGNETGEPDGVVNSFDMTYLGDPIPDFYYGISGYAAYKGFDLSFLLSGETGKQTMIEPVYGGGFVGGFNSIQAYFDSRAILDGNKEVISGSTNASGAGAGGGSEAAMHDLSFMRVNNIQLGYTLSKSVLNSMKLRDLRIYLNATNPFIFTNYVGWDQETSAITSGNVNRGGNQYVPMSKTISLGLSVKF